MMVNLSLPSSFSSDDRLNQKVYRKLLKAMSQPGKIIDIGFVLEKYQAYTENLELFAYSSTWAIAQSLLDDDCQVYISPGLYQPNFVHSLSFYTNAHITDERSEADFAFISIEEVDAGLRQFNHGFDDSPYQACTVIVQTPALTKEPQLTLSGEGIEYIKHLYIEGLDEDKVRVLQDNHRLYPCGLDFIFCSPHHLAALPRASALLFNRVVSSS